MTAKQLPPDPEGMNDARAHWARGALQTFMADTGSDPSDAIADLLCDIMHLCDREGDDGDNFEQFQTFETALDRARRHYADETLPLVEG